MTNIFNPFSIQQSQYPFENGQQGMLQNPYITNPNYPYGNLSPNSPTVQNKLVSYQDVLVYPYGIRQQLLTIKPEIRFDDFDNEDYQYKINKYLYNRILDKWLLSSKYCYILNYLTIDDNNTITVVSDIKEAKKNKKKRLHKNRVKYAVNYIEKNIFSMEDMRKVAIKVMNTLGFKWYDLGNKLEEKIIVEVAILTIKRKLKKLANIRI